MWYNIKKYSLRIKMATKSLERLIDEFNKLPGIGRKVLLDLLFMY